MITQNTSTSSPTQMSFVSCFKVNPWKWNCWLKMLSAYVVLLNNLVANSLLDEVV